MQPASVPAAYTSPHWGGIWGDMATNSEHDVSGFSIVEVIIAMFLLAIITVAILPALFQGIRLSAEQSGVATATRELNALVERVRSADPPTCADLQSAIDAPDATDGAGRAIAISGSHTCTGSSNGTTVTLTLQATSTSGTTLATVTSLVFIK